MDKNTLIGFLLIGVLVFGFTWYNQPSQADLERQRAYSDSIAAVQMNEAIVTAEARAAAATDSLKKDTVSAQQQAVSQFGAFAPAALGEEKLYTLENSVIRMQISSKGGYISSVMLKEFFTGLETDGEKQPLCLFDSKQDGSSFGFTFATNNQRIVNTSDMYFVADTIISDGRGTQTLVMRLQTNTSAYIDYVYTLKENDYMVDFHVQAHQMDSVMLPNINSLSLHWNSKIRQQERGRKFEDRYTQLAFKHVGDDMESLSESKDDKTTVSTGLKWIAFKDQFFSSILIADSANTFKGTQLASSLQNTDSPFLKDYQANTEVAFDLTGAQKTGFHFYFGPNKYQILKSFDKDVSESQQLGLQELVPLGLSILGWINRFVVIPIFNFFSSFISSFGIIILLLTLVIKLVLFPLTYKSYLSTAKMRVLKPQIDEINERIPATKPRERQQATMALYSKVGVSPLGGCLPMLLQMPFLFALFFFFPASIELRGQSFLWATDLSSYDAIISWQTHIPIISEYFGNHLSLFCLLMTITNVVYTHINMQSTMNGQQQIPGMKVMMYVMPVFLLVFLNGYASGLTYYYFISTLITISQTLIIRSFVDEKKLLQKLHEHARNPKKQKKSGFMARLEEAQRKQAEIMRQQQQQQKKKKK